jgi:hypothetical protein
MSKIRLPLCHHRRLGAAQGDERLDEAKLYKELGVLTKEKEKWEESIPYVSSLLNYESVKIQAKVLWLLGEMGLLYPQSVQDTVPTIVSFLDSPELLLRERAVNALGRIGRGDYSIIESYWASLFRFASDEEPKVRLAFIWASGIRQAVCGAAATSIGNRRESCSKNPLSGRNQGDRSEIERAPTLPSLAAGSALYQTQPAVDKMDEISVAEAKEAVVKSNEKICAS